jgi:general secretion pathway protein C
MRVFRASLTAAVPVSIALAAFLAANGVSALVEATMTGSMATPSLGDGKAVAGSDVGASGDAHRSADAVLDRNPFDHVTRSLRERAPGPPGQPGQAGELDTDPRTAPACDGVRALVVVGHEDPSVAFAALEVDGKRILRKRGGDAGGKHVAHVGRDRVWLEGKTGLCQAQLFGAPPPAGTGRSLTTADPSAGAGARSLLEIEIGKQIAKTGPNEYVIERSAVERILEAQSELMKQRIVQEKEGDRVVGVKVLGIKPGSLLSMLGIENGDRLETLNGFEMSNPEKMLEAYARLRSGADRLQIHLTRAGKPINVDYTIR